MYQSLCQEYHWTPHQIDQMTLPEMRIACYKQPEQKDAISHFNMKQQLSPQERLLAMRLTTI